MTVIATTFLNLPFANQILDAFNEYSNEYEFTAEGVFHRINPPACPRCGKRMSHNGYNRYSILDRLDRRFEALEIRRGFMRYKNRQRTLEPS